MLGGPKMENSPRKAATASLIYESQNLKTKYPLKNLLLNG
jgi:hypothetical protein